MENATKALIMVAGVLLALLILSIGIYLKGSLGKTTDAYNEKLDTVELRKYNSNFETYVDRTNVTAQEIATVASLARQKERGTKIYIGTEEITNKASDKDFEDWKNKFLSENILTEIKDSPELKNSYSYVSIAYDADGMVTELKFKKN